MMVLQQFKLDDDMMTIHHGVTVAHAQTLCVDYL